MTITSPTVLELPGTPVAVIRRQVPQAALARVVPECCGRVWQVLKAQGIRGGRNMALYLDGAIHLEAGVECAAPFAELDGVVRSELPSGNAVTVTHAGPYAGLAAAHRAIHEWCAANGYRITGPSWEVYGHWDAAWDNDPSLIRTDVFYQVVAAEARAAT